MGASARLELACVLPCGGAEHARALVGGEVLYRRNGRGEGVRGKGGRGWEGEGKKGGGGGGRKEREEKEVDRRGGGEEVKYRMINMMPQ